MVRGILPDGTLLPNKCELGDLQTVFVYLRRDKTVVKMRSVIFQAKMKVHGGSHVIDHAQQRQLYDLCLHFQYEGFLKNAQRELPANPVDRERALQYLFVGSGPVRARTIPSLASHGAFADYGEHLLRFLNDSTGLDVDMDNHISSGWDGIMADMFDHVAPCFTSSNRCRQADLCDILNHFNSFSDHDVYFVGPSKSEGEFGGGIQFVIVWDSELGEEETFFPHGGITRLRELADLYDSSDYVDKNERVRRKGQLCNQMTAVISSDKVPLEIIRREIMENPSNGLIAGLALFLHGRLFDELWQNLIPLIPKITWKHTLSVVLQTIAGDARGNLLPEHLAELHGLVHDRLKSDGEIANHLRQIEMIAHENQRVRSYSVQTEQQISVRWM